MNSNTSLERVVKRLAHGDEHRSRRLRVALALINCLLALLGGLGIFMGLPLILLAVIVLGLSEMGLIKWLDDARPRAMAWWGTALSIALFIPVGILLPSEPVKFVVLFILNGFGLAGLAVALWPAKSGGGKQP